MKKIFTLVFVLFLVHGFSQNSILDPDQNPRYKESMDKYMKISDSLNKLQGTTVQNTFKAIDELQDIRDARLKRKLNRINGVNRRNRWNNYYSSWGFNNPWWNTPSWGYNNWNNWGGGFNRPWLQLGWNSGWNNPFNIGLNWWWF